MRRRGGFTLVELLVVIGIIAVLIAILLPVLNKVREQAQLIKCQSNQRQILVAIFAYTSANNGILPIPGAIEELQGYYFALQNTGPGMLDFNTGTMLPYIGPSPQVRQQVFSCPSDGPDRQVETNNPGDDGDVADPTLTVRNFSYCLNARLMLAEIGSIQPPGGGRRIPLIRGLPFTRVRHTEHKMLVLEPARPRWAFNEAVVGNALATGDPIINLLSHRHGGQCNAGFADGHVERFDPAILSFIPDPLDNRRHFLELEPTRDENN